MRRLLLLALLTSLTLPMFAQKKKNKKPELPQAVLAAQFVYVTGWHGTQYDFNVPPEERAAIMRVQNAVDRFHGYHVVNTPDQADLMLIVKVSNIGLARRGIGLPDPTGIPTGTGIPIGTPPPQTSGIGSMGGPFGGGAEAGTGDDMLLVSLNPNDRPDEAPAIWRRSAKNGFQARNVPLIEAFKKAVDESEKVIQDNKKP